MSILVLTSISTLLLCVFFNARLASPSVIHTGTWTVVFIIGLFFQENYHPPSDSFIASWMIWHGSFIFSSVFFYFLKINLSNTRKRELLFHQPAWPNYYPIIDALILSILILLFFEFIRLGPINFFNGLRQAFAFREEGQFKFSFFLRSFPFFYALYLTSIVSDRNRKNAAHLFAYLFLYAISTAGKFTFLMIFLPLLINELTQTNRIKSSQLALILFFLITAVLTQIFRETNSEHSLSIVAGAYLYAPIAAFGELTPFQSPYFGYESLRFFYSLLFKLGLSTTPPPPDYYEYAFVPHPTNVYTALRPFFVDFGLYGIAFGGLAYSIFFNTLFFLTSHKNILAHCLYLAFSFALIAQPFGELLFLNISLILQITISILFIQRLRLFFTRDLIFAARSKSDTRKTPTRSTRSS